MLLSTETGKEVTRLKHYNTLYFVAFSPDGNIIITQDKDSSFKNHALHLWAVKKSQSVPQEEASIRASTKEVGIGTDTKAPSLPSSVQKKDNIAVGALGRTSTGEKNQVVSSIVSSTSTVPLSTGKKTTLPSQQKDDSKVQPVANPQSTSTVAVSEATTKTARSVSQESKTTLSFTDGVDLEDDSQKECCIQ